jgi:hypothetical protein
MNASENRHAQHHFPPQAICSHTYKYGVDTLAVTVLTRGAIFGLLFGLQPERRVKTVYIMMMPLHASVKDFCFTCFPRPSLYPIEEEEEEEEIY